MRITFLFFVFVSAQLAAFSQRNPVVILGAMPVFETAAIDATEVTIAEYTYFIINNQFDSTLFPNLFKLSPSARLYFQDLQKSEGSSFVKIVKNHAVHAKSYGVNGFALTKAYYKFVEGDSTGFTIYNPVVAVSFEQAERFCEWRQNNENRNRTVKLRITLPPLEIYKKLISNMDSLQPNKKNCNEFQFNFAHTPCSTKHRNKDMSQQGFGLVRADRFKPTFEKLYNIQGNAAEMTSTKGIAVGGSFKHSAKESMSDEVQYYTTEKEWLGFRCYISLQDNYFRKDRQ